MSVVLLAIRSSGILFFFLSYTVLPVKSLIAIILVVQELNFVVHDCGE